jgi:quercetin dioxygenase-like cupin family protein
MPRVAVPLAVPLLAPPGRGPLTARLQLEGRAIGLAHLTLTLGASPPGQGTRLHRHDAEEPIILHAGRGTYSVGDATDEAGPGDVAVIPSGVPHRSVNHTQQPLVHAGVFSAGSFAMEVVGDEPAGRVPSWTASSGNVDTDATQLGTRRVAPRAPEAQRLQPPRQAGRHARADQHGPPAGAVVRPRARRRALVGDRVDAGPAPQRGAVVPLGQERAHLGARDAPAGAAARRPRRRARPPAATAARPHAEPARGVFLGPAGFPEPASPSGRAPGSAPALPWASGASVGNGGVVGVSAGGSADTGVLVGTGMSVGTDVAVPVGVGDGVGVSAGSDVGVGAGTPGGSGIGWGDCSWTGATGGGVQSGGSSAMPEAAGSATSGR